MVLSPSGALAISHLAGFESADVDCVLAGWCHHYQEGFDRMAVGSYPSFRFPWLCGVSGVVLHSPRIRLTWFQVLVLRQPGLQCLYLHAPCGEDGVPVTIGR